MYTSQPLVFFFISTATTIHCEPNFFADSVTSLGFKIAAVLIETLSAPALNKSLMSSNFLTPPPTVRGTKTLSAALSTVLIIIFLSSFEAVISKKVI